jgi:hypothetical protein
MYNSSVTGFLDFFHRPVLKYPENTTLVTQKGSDDYWILGLCPSSCVLKTVQDLDYSEDVTVAALITQSPNVHCEDALNL